MGVKSLAGLDNDECRHSHRETWNETTAPLFKPRTTNSVVAQHFNYPLVAQH